MFPEKYIKLYLKKRSDLNTGHLFQCSDFFPLSLLAQSTNFCAIYRYVRDRKRQNIWKLSVVLINYHSINGINLILNKMQLLLNVSFFSFTEFNNLILWPLQKEVNIHIHLIFIFASFECNCCLICCVICIHSDDLILLILKVVFN